MKRKMLLGSIISVVILILFSFTSVVGYNNIESNLGVSPLFNIRSSRAIDEEDKILTSDYVGKEDDFNLLIPDRDDIQEKIRQIIEYIQELDDESFNKFVQSIINRIQKNKEVIDVNVDEIITTIFYLRDNQNLKDNILPNMMKLYTNKKCTSDNYIPGCYIILLIRSVIGWGILALLFLITSRFNCISDSCFTNRCSA